VKRPRYLGVRHVATFNWPFYVAALFTFVVSALVSRMRSPAIRAVAGLVAGSAAWWSFASLFVTHWVHDRSDLYTLGWLDDALPAPERWALLHAGLDEHSVEITRRFGPGDVFDFFDPGALTEASIARARHTPTAGIRRSPAELGLAPGSYDTIFVLLALHEIRDDALRVRFLSQLRAALARGGRIVLVDHYLDGPNVLAFGPGARHFLTPRRYLGSIAAAGLAIERDRHITPFLRLLVVGR
jgi:SAM-dependent methyltransferase